MSADLSQPIRAALVGEAAITALLPAYSGGYPIFTRRPAPDDAPYPMVLVSPDIVHEDDDGIDNEQPLITRDVSAYGQNDTADGYRAVEQIAYAVRDLFHRRPQAITPPTGWSCVSVSARGPIPAPADDENSIGRLVTLRIRLAKLD